MNSFERFNEEKLPTKKCFYLYKKKKKKRKEKISNDGKISDGHVSFKDYLTGEKFGISLTWKIWVIIRINT